MTGQGGGITDEVGKVLGAIEGWLRAQSAPGSDDAGEPPAPAATALVRELLAQGTHVVATLRTARPEVVEHLTDAVGSVLLAVKALTEPPAGAGSPDSLPADADPAAHQAPTVVQHIPIS